MKRVPGRGMDDPEQALAYDRADFEPPRRH
jgi:hypothetical protein